MAKTTIKFSAVPYQVGTGSQTRTGYRPQLEAQTGLYDLDFCKEVVTEKRLAMSADELLHAMEMVGEVGPAKVASDGRPRGITKLLKFNRYAQGNLESPTSPWNDTCRAYVRAQLMFDAEKEINATFVNVNEGIGVKLNYVAWLGAQTVTNVVKVGKSFAAYGNHMEWLDGDTAKLIVGTASYDLTCTESDVAHAVFAWPSGLAPEAGTQATFVMLSRGGVEEGEVYTSKKTVTILAGDPSTITKVTQTGRADNTVLFSETSPFTIHGTNLTLSTSAQSTDKVLIELYQNGTKVDQGDLTVANKITSSSDTAIVCSGLKWDSNVPDGDWWDAYPDSKFVIVKDGTRYEFPVTFKGE